MFWHADIDHRNVISFLRAFSVWRLHTYMLVHLRAIVQPSYVCYVIDWNFKYTSNRSIARENFVYSTKLYIYM